MKGTTAHNEKYDHMSKTKISKADPVGKFCLTGWYNSMIVNRSYVTAYIYLGYIAEFVQNIDSIDELSVDDYNAYLAKIKSKKASSKIDAYHALQKYSKYLKSKGVCREDYMKYIDRPKRIELQETAEKRETGFLTKSEAKRLVMNSTYNNDHRATADIWKARDYCILMIFLNTGIRCSALYKLDISDIDLNEHTIRVLEKGDKSRKIYISDTTVLAIKRWLEYRKRYLGDLKEDALIISNRRTRMTTESIYVLIKKLGADIKGKNISPHKLRATFGTQLYNKTHDVYFVQQAMGHSNPKTTEIYIRGQKNETSKKASDLMAGFID